MGLEENQMSLIKIDINKAKEVKKDQLRMERAPILNQLDIEFMRAVEQGDTVKAQEISQKKQVLRDCTNSEELSNAQTVEQLKQITLQSILGE